MSWYDNTGNTWGFVNVGQDEFGNRYYRTRGGKIDPTLLMQRRWVIYNGVAEASSIPPSWHGWMHHTVDVPPTQDGYKPREWEKPHVPNMTGTPAAYRPSGSTLASGKRVSATYGAQTLGPFAAPPEDLRATFAANCRQRAFEAAAKG